MGKTTGNEGTVKGDLNAESRVKTGVSGGVDDKKANTGRQRKASLHENHRKRVRNRFAEYGLTAMEDHQVLELLLFYSIPRYDTNEIAHELLNTFGSLANVFDAPRELLEEVPGLGKESALFLKLLPAIWSRYRLSQTNDIAFITGKRELIHYVLPLFTDKKNEQLVCVYTNNAGKILKRTVETVGSADSVLVNSQNIGRTAVLNGATCVALAHSHPGGYAAPSHADIEATVGLAKQLLQLGIRILDHVIVAEEGVFFFSSCEHVPSDLLLFSGLEE